MPNRACHDEGPWGSVQKEIQKAAINCVALYGWGAQGDLCIDLLIVTRRATDTKSYFPTMCTELPTRWLANL